MSTILKHFVVVLLLFMHSAFAQNVAFLVSMEVTGMTQQCVYAFGADRYTLTIAAHENCVLSIIVD
jgi:hypothetical protein